MMPIYVSTDLHFNHMKLHDTFGDRPANFQELELNSHAEIPAEAMLIFLGDFCIGKDEEMHKQWNDYTGHIQHRILVRGNHDNKPDSWYLRHGWDFVCRSTILRLFGKRVLFSHIPKDHSHYPTTDLNIHGHTHGNAHRDEDIRHLIDPNYHIEIAMEHTNYSPVKLTDKFVLGHKNG